MRSKRNLVIVEKSQIKIDESEEHLNICLDLRDGSFLHYEILTDVVATNTKVMLSSDYLEFSIILGF